MKAGKAIALGAVSVFVSVQAFAATVKTFMVPSAAMAKDIPVTVMLPDGYPAQGSKRYPVVYMLHGAGDNHTTFADEVGRKGVDKYGFIGICPDGERKSWWYDSPVNPRCKYETFVAGELVAWVDRTYRTIPEKSARAIGGLSIGALQSIHITANHPDMFDYVGLFSPMVHPVPHPSAHCTFNRRLKEKQKTQFATSPELYWVMIGRTDFFYPRMIAYHNYLERNAYEHEYRTTRGGHQWYNWEDYSILFMQRLWGN